MDDLRAMWLTAVSASIGVAPSCSVTRWVQVGALDCETIYQLGIETAALGKVPNAPTLNSMSADMG